MNEPTDLWTRVDDAAREVAAKFTSLGVAKIDAVPYQDSLDRAGVHFTVWLRDHSDGKEYGWTEMGPVEKALSTELERIDVDRIPYTDYVLESEG